MTLIITIPHPQGIVMGADSRKTTELKQISESATTSFDPFFEFSEMNKVYTIPKIGCITCWGDLTSIGLKLKEFTCNLKSNIKTVKDLAYGLLDLLNKNIVPENNEEVGFHVTGYLNGIPKIYHTFYGRETGESSEVEQRCIIHDELNLLALYNGKPGYAHNIIQFLLHLEKEVGMVKWLTKLDLSVTISFITFLLRYASNLDKTIGGTIRIITILSDNTFKEELRDNDKTYDFDLSNNYSPTVNGIQTNIPLTAGTSSFDITVEIKHDM